MSDSKVSDLELKNEDTLPKQVWILGAVSALADISSEMLYPVTPIFLSQILGASMVQIGLIEACAEFTANIVKWLAGDLSDRFHNRKFFVVSGYLLAGIAKPIIGLAQSWPVVLMARSLDRFGKGIRTSPRDALLAESVPQHKLGHAFGIHRAMDTAGAVVGPLIGLLCLQFFTDLHVVYFLALIPALLAVIASLFVKEISPNKKQLAEKRPSPWGLIKTAPPEFLKFLAIWTFFSFTNSGDFFLILKMKTDHLSLTLIILCYSIFNFVYAALSPSLGKLSDRYSYKFILRAGLVVFAFVYLCFANITSFTNSWYAFIAILAVYGVYYAATEGIVKAFASNILRNSKLENSMGSYLGLQATLTGIGVFVANLTAGALWDHLSPTAPFWLGAIGAIVTFLIL